MKLYYSESRDALYEVFAPHGSSVTVEALYGVKKSQTITKDYYGGEFELPEDAKVVAVHGFTGHEFFRQLWNIARVHELLSLNSSPDGFYSKECQAAIDSVKHYKNSFTALF